MRDVLLILLMVGVVLLGHRLMDRLDRFLDRHIRVDPDPFEETDGEDGK